MFNRSTAINNLLSSSNFSNYFITLINKVEKLKVLNSYQKIIAHANTPNVNSLKVDSLKIIFGEATQNLDSFIYGVNDKKIAGNSFLNPKALLDKPCGKNSGFRASDLHDFLAERTVTALDLFLVPLPSEMYNSASLRSILTDINALGGQQRFYIQQKVDEIVDLAKAIDVKKIKTISRYGKPHVLAMGSEFNRQLKTALNKTGISLLTFPGDLSNGNVGIDINKFNSFI